MSKLLFSGLTTLNRDGNTKEQFGTISATSPLANQGNLQLFLNSKNVTTIVDETGIHITLTETQAHKLYTSINQTLVRIVHLRSLHKLGKLDSSAIFEGIEDE